MLSVLPCHHAVNTDLSSGRCAWIGGEISLFLNDRIVIWIFHSNTEGPESSTDSPGERHQRSKCPYEEPGLRSTSSATSGNFSLFYTAESHLWAQAVRAEPFPAASPLPPWPLTSSYRAAQWKVMRRAVGVFREPVAAGAGLWLADTARHVRAVQYVLSTRQSQECLWQNVRESQAASFSWVFWWNIGPIC